MRQAQFPVGVEGMLIRQEAPSSRWSCIGTTAVSATELMAMRTISPAAVRRFTSRPR